MIGWRSVMHGAPFFNNIWVPIADRKFNVRVAGSGKPILFLHGYPLDNHMWGPVISLLANRFLCIAPDLRGFGQNAEEPMSFSMMDLADDCAKLLAAMQIRRPVAVCGLSMGGYVAMQFIERHRTLVGNAILTNTRSNADDAMGVQARRTSAQLALRESAGAAVAPMLEKLLCRKTLDEQPNTVELVREMMTNTRASTVAWAQMAMSTREEFSQKMQAWDLPVYCVGGAEDPITPRSAIEQMARSIPGAKVHIIQDAGHLTPLECPTHFASLVEQADCM